MDKFLFKGNDLCEVYSNFLVYLSLYPMSY